MRIALLAVLAAVAAAAGPAKAETEYPYCSIAGIGMEQDCSYETLAQCQAATLGVGTACVTNPRYQRPAPPPIQPQARPPGRPSTKS